MACCGCNPIDQRLTSLTVERWRELIIPKLHPIHFYQMTSTVAPMTKECSSLVREFAHQANGTVGRQSIREAILRAEQSMAAELGFWPGERAFCDQVRRRDSIKNTNRFVLPQKYVKAIGREIYTILGDYDVTLHDLDGDGFSEVFRIRVPDFTGDKDTIRLYFAEDDRWDMMGDDFSYEIRHIKTKMDGDDLVVQGRTWLIVRPYLYQGDVSHSTITSNIFSLNGDNDATFAETLSVSTVEVERTECDGGVWPSATCSLPTGSETCGSCGLFVEMDFCVIDGEDGYIEAIPAHCAPLPERFQVSYIAGGPGNFWEKAVARFAAAELGEAICGCSGVHKITYWSDDLSSARDDKNREFIRLDAFDNPFGTRRGHIEAWLQVKQHAKIVPVLL